MDQGLLLPLVLAAAAVVLAVRLWDRHRRRREASEKYLKGVRSMISDDPDAAIEALSDAARLEAPQALETYLALGELFRRTGDLARAIRLHRNMLVGPGLEAGRRPEIERELAEDYRRSGMLAEAAELLAPLARGDRRAAEALCEVRADQGAWREAAALQRTLGGPGSERRVAHLLAAAARADLAATPSRPAEARQAAGEAVAADPACAAAGLALAEALAAGGDGPAAIRALVRALDAEPRAAVLAWPALSRLPRPEDGSAALAVLDGLAARAPRDAALRMLQGRLLHRQGRRAEALQALRSALDLDEGGEVTLALRDLLRESEGATPEGSPDDLAARHDLVVTALRRRARSVACARCGAEAPARAWRCRGCGAFDAFP